VAKLIWVLSLVYMTSNKCPTKKVACGLYAICTSSAFYMYLTTVSLQPQAQSKPQNPESKWYQTPSQPRLLAIYKCSNINVEARDGKSVRTPSGAWEQSPYHQHHFHPPRHRRTGPPHLRPSAARHWFLSSLSSPG
jgi:hypothetical protein